MKKLALAFATLPGAAFAHAGDHGAAGVGSLIAHALSEPDHALTLMAVVVAPVALWLWLRGRG